MVSVAATGRVTWQDALLAYLSRKFFIVALQVRDVIKDHKMRCALVEFQRQVLLQQ